MRIALVASSFLPRFGGVEEHVSFLARELRRRGHATSIWAVDQGDSTPSEDRGTPLRYLHSPLPSRSLRGILTWLRDAPRAWRQWRQAFRDDRPDVIVIQCFGANGPFATLLARLTRTPLVYSNHGETFMDANDAFEESALIRRALGATLTQAAAITSCSRYAAADLARFGPPRDVVVVYNGIDLDLAAAAVRAPLPARYIAAVGRLVRNKGLDRLITAFAAAADDPLMDDVSLVIAGDGPERAALAALARELAISHRVVFLGALPREQVRALLDGATIHVVPSLVEAFGIVVLEGWRSGAPVLVTDQGGPPEFVTEDVDGLLFDPVDISGLSRLLVSAASDPALRERIGATGRASAGRFSWSAVADAYEAVLRDVTADPHAKPSRSSV